MNNPNQDNGNDIFLYGKDVVKIPEESQPSQGKRKLAPIKLISIILLLVSLLLIIVIIAMINSGYSVKNIIINGESPYSEEEIRAIVDAYFAENGKSYFTLSEEKLQELFMREMTYIKSIKAEKISPDTLVLNLEGEKAEAFIVYNSEYYLLNSEMKVLEKLSLMPIRPYLIKLDVDVPSEISVGSILSFPEDGKMDAESYSRIYSALVSSGLRDKVSSIDVKNKFDLNMTLQGGVDVKIGNIKDIEEKLSGLAKWLDENPDEIKSTLNIDISVLKKIYISYD